MFTLPTPTTDSPLEFKRSGLEGALATGTLSSGREYEICLSRKSAVSEGLHLIMAFPEGIDLTPQEESESLFAFLHYAKSLPLAGENGIRLGLNLGALRTRNSWHAHIIIPGSEDEIKAAPRLVDPWGV